MQAKEKRYWLYRIQFLCNTHFMQFMTQSKALADAILSVLLKKWPGFGTDLQYKNCFELIIAVILSAQCTDEQVNKVTPLLFAKWPDPASLALAPLEAIEQTVYSTGFYKHKARHIQETARIISESYNGKIPETFEALLELPGVGRKTAHLVQSLCYNIPGLIIDTHVLRITKRTGLALSSNPYKTEKILASLIAQKLHARASFALNRQAKHICTAKKPQCDTCCITALCKTYSPENFSQ